MDDFLTFAPLVVTFIGLVYFARIKMKKDGVIYIIVYYTKWFVGVVITMVAFYVIMITGNFLKEHGYSAVFSLLVGALVWYFPMNYSSNLFAKLEKRFKKD